MKKGLLWSALVIAGLLTACGGGNPLTPGDTTDPTNPLPGAGAVNTVSVSLYQCDSFDSANPSVADCSPTLAVYDDPITVIMVRALENGDRATSKKVEITADKGLLSVPDGTVITNSDGEGFMTLAAGQSTGVVTVSASFEDAALAQAIATIYGTPTVSSQNIAISLWDCLPSQAGCQEISNFSAASPALVVVRATNNQQPAANKKVIVSTDKGTLFPSDGVALTNSDGYAYVDISAGKDSGIVTLTANYENARDEVLVTINAVEINVALSSTLLPGDELSDGSTLAVTATLTTTDGEPYLAPVEVMFSSQCASSDKAELDDVILSSDGTAIATYKPNGCEGNDVVVASVTLGNSSDTASLTIAIAETPVGNIEFSSAAPNVITLQGTGGRTTSVITFVVTDANGRPKQGVDVDFTLASGDHFVNLSVPSARTNSLGEVSTTVSAGSLPGAYRVQASVAGSSPKILTVSRELAVATGLPDSDSFSLSLDVFNPEAAATDGVVVVATIRAADHFNNPVSDGTTISFIAEGGVVEPSCSTVNGACSVKWTSQDPRPSDLRVTLLASAEGEEYFRDKNGDGIYQHDQDDFFALYDVAEAYRDEGENGTYDGTDQFLDRNENGVYDGANSIYNGQLCSLASAAVGQCSQELVDINAQAIIVMSGYAPEIYFCDYDGVTVDCSTAITQIQDYGSVYACARDGTPDGTLNPVPYESTINFSVLGSSDMKVVGKTAYLQGNTHVAIRDPSLGIDRTSACPGGLYAVGVDTSEGYGKVLVELETTKAKYTTATIEVLAPAP